MNLFRSRCLLALASWKHFFTVLAVCAVTSTPTFAQTMYRPTDATTSMGTTPDSPLSSIIDGSGLSTDFTSGVTNLATYTATHDSANLNNEWLSAIDTTTGTVTFDLGSGFSTPLAQFVLWNDGPGYGARVVGFSLSASNNATFSSGVTNLGSFSAANPSPGTNGAVIKEVFSFAPTIARYYRMTITSNAGNNTTAIGEVAFAGTVAAVNGPEPGTFALLALGTLAGVGGILAQRKRIFANRRKA